MTEAGAVAGVDGNGGWLGGGDGCVGQRDRTAAWPDALEGIEGRRGQGHRGRAADDLRMHNPRARCRNHQIVRIQIPLRGGLGGLATADHQQRDAVRRKALRRTPCRGGRRCDCRGVGRNQRVRRISGGAEAVQVEGDIGRVVRILVQDHDRHGRAG